ncbi:hypothetical protein S40285_10370 [Stachybotrys chlorohalonatus IBT 40285]|uniref:Uncharacterized protein n=1 Tax=Stachybotrys chlorohalonatus (strain IBT 40285) TaxID=1283841 RepID=A0A084QK18_STAC4|nr:hypothetical protein S40285_10370 [Stachybotrys chlorohalonata IBT 40285]
MTDASPSTRAGRLGSRSGSSQQAPGAFWPGRFGGDDNDVARAIAEELLKTPQPHQAGAPALPAQKVP